MPTAPTPGTRATGGSGAWARAEGQPFPLGVTWIEAERAYNFALYSKHATRVVLLLYDERDLVRPACAYELDPACHRSGRVWHCRLSETVVDRMRYYAYSVTGPPPAGLLEWHAFDAGKVLLDPYARAVYVPPAFDREAAIQPGSNAGRAPLGVLERGKRAPDRDDDRPPRHEAELVLYELHVGGFTRDPSSGVAAPRRGTYAGLVEKIPYLQELGITAVELMPVFQHEPAVSDYWGYMPLAFFAPHGGFATGGEPFAAEAEFRALVRALHAAGIEVVLDVVYNHTCERGVGGPTYGFRGIDNSTYYLMTPGPEGGPPLYADFTGTGNTLNCANRAVRKLIVDSMHHWARDLHVDGFRFDLASVFARRADGSLDFTDPPVLAEIRSHDEFAPLRLIAEPWDAAGAYVLGRAFPGTAWQQWNGQFRDDVRRFVRSDPGMVPALMRRLYGSDDLFPDDAMHAFHPWQSVNYVTCHDGFTLWDLVSYNERRNWANGHDNRDGPAESFSWNCGWEGDEGAPADVVALRQRQARNLLCLLFLANGTPMLRAGDEFLQTQGGNSNPYNQDNATSWLNWTRLEANAAFHRFARGLIAFRKAHPSLSRSRCWREDVRWYGTQGSPDLGPEARWLAYCLHGASQDDDDLYVMINAASEPVGFDIQDQAHQPWRRVIDTARESPDDIVPPGDAAPPASRSCVVAARSVVVLARRGG